MLDLVDPDGKLDELEDQIRTMNDYGLPERW